MNRFLLFSVLFSVATAANEQPALVDRIKNNFPTATTYSRKSPHSGALKEVYLFYDKKNVLLGGAGVRPFDTYSTLQGVLVLKKNGNTLTVKELFFPNLGTKIRKRKIQQYIQKLAGKTKDAVVMDANRKKVKFDAVSGATRNKRIIYLTLNKMASILGDVLVEAPNWERKPISADTGEEKN